MTSLTLTGHLTVADHKQHVAIPFTVPAGTTRLVGRFATTPKRATDALFDNMVCLTIFGPNGCRGARHNNPVRDFAIDADIATPGYTPGAIEPGDWTVVMDCFRILGPEPIEWTLEVTFETAALPAPAPVAARVVPDKGPGWYRGDLHAHTLHSDSRWDLPGLVGFARANGLDFVTLTDHNTVSGLAEFERLSDADLLTMGGNELTTHYGHCLALGTRRWHEWRGNSMPGVTMPGIAAEVEASGALYVIAHPRSPGDPSCTGCRWEYEDMMPGPARAVEIWNGPWSDYNEDGLTLYREWLDQGLRIVATAGTDTHGPDHRKDPCGFNTVFAESLTEADILAAVRAGHNVLSSGPRLTLDLAAADGARAMVGESLDGQPVSAELSFETRGVFELRLVGTGFSRSLGQVDGDGSTTLPLDLAGSGWVMAELRDAEGVLHAVTNPVWFGA